MKKLNIIFISFLLLGSFFVSKRVLSANTDIVINEIGAYPTADHQWIEIWNKGTSPINLSGWKLWDPTVTNGHGLTVSTTTDPVVASGEYAVIVKDVSSFLSDYPNFLGSIFDSSFILSKRDGGILGLKDNNGVFVETSTYPGGLDHSWERKNPYLADYSSSNWQEHTSGNTVGTVNSNFFSGNITTSSTGNNNSFSSALVSSPALLAIWSNLKINEFVSDPDSGNEWVELFNPTTSSLDLVSGYICDSRNTTSTCKVISGMISASSWLKIDLLTNSYLNNTGDSVILKNSDGDTIDQINYSDSNAPVKGQSLARIDDGVDSDNNSDWSITTEPTPGAENIIIAPTASEIQSGSGSGGYYYNSNDSVSVTATSSKKISISKTSVSKEKVIGLKWKIKYDLRLRQGEEAVFDATKSLDPRGGRIEYSWNFGDKIMAGAIVNYSFTTSGVHEVIIHTTSTAGTVDEKKITIMVYPFAETAGSGIIFSELLPRASSAEDEYVRLKNISDRTIDLSNWKIAYKNDVFEIPVSTTLAASDYLTFYQTITGFSLNNSGGQLLLLNQNNILLDEIEYGKSDEGMVYKFIDDKWNWVMPTTSDKNLIVKINSSATKFSGRFFTDIASARAGQKGDWARVKGAVSVLPGVFGSQYFYITDGIGGIEVYQNKKDFPPLEPGDFVEVYGSIFEANGIKRINLKSKDNVDILSMDNFVSSTELNLDEIDESLAGGMVQIIGEITDLKSSYMYVDSGVGEIMVYFKQGANIDKTKFKKGENVRVNGILEQTKTGWQIWPHSSNDIESLGLSADLINEEKLNNTNETKSKYMTVTVGGVATLILGFLFRGRGVFLKRAIGVVVGFIRKDKDIG
ncbi:MAG TPA: lamin tail domain-containing protein [Candidatus Udaeobacter sp.]|nr:lamin tail domain-containing protein [Candidatus Udaeobacter sp.]